MSSSKSSSRRASKTRKQEIDDVIEHLSHEVFKLNDFVSKSELEFSLMTAKLKREKVKALAAVAKSQVLLADMEILIAENELLSDLQKLKNNSKMLKLEAKSQHKCDDGTLVSKKSKSKSSSAPSIEAPNPKRRKRSSASISSIDTVILETLSDNCVESTSGLQSSVILPKSESPGELEVSLPSSLKAAFNIPYEETENQTHRKSLEKKDMKGRSSSVTKHDSKTKTVSDLKRSTLGPKSDNCKDLYGTPRSSRPKSLPSTSTSIPIRHNMPAIITQAKHSYRASAL